MPDPATAEQSDRPHILVVDDDPEICRLISQYLEANGFRMSTAGDGAQLRLVLSAGPVDLVLLDLGLPGEDGLSLLRHLEQDWHGPVIVVSGRGESVERVVGLELGADDYISKPFDLRELLARVRSVLRRSHPDPSNGIASANGRIGFDGLRFNPMTRSLIGRAGEEIVLTNGEFEMLQVLLKHPNQVLSRDQLMVSLHGRDAGPFDRAVDVQVGRLRRKIEIDPARPKLIKAVRGAGYMFAGLIRPL